MIARHAHGSIKQVFIPLLHLFRRRTHGKPSLIGDDFESADGLALQEHPAFPAQQVQSDRQDLLDLKDRKARDSSVSSRDGFHSATGSGRRWRNHGVGCRRNGSATPECAQGSELAAVAAERPLSAHGRLAAHVREQLGIGVAGAADAGGVEIGREPGQGHRRRVRRRVQRTRRWAHYPSFSLNVLALSTE